MAVAGQELLDTERSRAMARPDQHNISQSMRDQLHAAEEEGAHQDVAQLAVRLHEGKQVVPVNLDHFPRLARPHLDEPGATRKHVRLAGELPRSMDRDKRFAGAGCPNDFDLTSGDNEERHDPVAGLDEYFPTVNRTHPSVDGDARHLRRRQGRKHLVNGCGKGC